MPSILQFMKKHAEAIPDWLVAMHGKEATPDLSSFFRSRVVFYPGSGVDDWHALGSFGLAGAAHCFVHADYGIPLGQIKDLLIEQGVRFEAPELILDARAKDSTQDEDAYDEFLAGGGTLFPEDGEYFSYRVLGTPLEVPMEALFPADAISHLAPGVPLPQGTVPPYALFAILQKQDRSWAMRHIPERLALLFLGGDGIDAYDRRFCQAGQRPPYAVLLQDHGLGGNYNRFGLNGLLDGLVRSTAVRPEWVLVAENTEIWDGFELVEGVDRETGGGANYFRSLYGSFE